MAGRSMQGGVVSPALAGLVAAATALASALALTVIPALVAQLSAQQSEMTSLAAILLGIDALVLAHGGSLVLDAGAISGTFTLTPFGLTAVLLLVTALGMRRAAGKLHLVEDDGTLRVRALRDIGTALVAFVLLYAIGLGALAALARGAEVRPVAVSAVVSGALIAVLGGIGGTLSAVRRTGGAGLPPVRILYLLPAPYGALARAVGIALAGLGALGLVTVTVLVAVRFRTLATIFDHLDPGIGGGLVLTLLQLALLPLLAVWALAVLLGGTLTVGTGTSLSYAGVHTGVLPALPLLGALPDPGPWPTWAWLLVLLPAGVVALGAVSLARALTGAERRARLVAFIGYPVTLLITVLVVMGLATGSIGGDRLQSLGPQVSSLLLPVLLMVALPSAAVFGVLATGFIPWLRRSTQALRIRVEEVEDRIDAGSRGTADDDRADGPADDESADSQSAGTGATDHPADAPVTSSADPPPRT